MAVTNFNGWVRMIVTNDALTDTFGGAVPRGRTFVGGHISNSTGAAGTITFKDETASANVMAILAVAANTTTPLLGPLRFPSGLEVESALATFEVVLYG